MRKLNLVGTTRASFHMYNDSKDVQSLLQAVVKTKEYFKVGK
jgi:cysteine desulfurase/selenocysteine lyase